MTSNPSFVISEFKNPSGEVVYRVSGWLEGKRYRKNFPTRPEAETERQVLEACRLQRETGFHTTVTRLTNDQLHEAETAFRLLANHPHRLSFYVEFALANYRDTERNITLADAIAGYMAAKQTECERTLLSGSQLGSIKYELKVFQQYFPTLRLGECSPTLLVQYFERGAPSLKTYNNRRGILSTFFKFALRKDWIINNPLEKVDYHRIAHRRGSAKTLSAIQAKELMSYVENYENGALVPFFALCLFVGIRPCVRRGEIFKLRPEQIHLDTGVIHIEPDVSKVRMKRHVTIQPNLSAWLRAYPLEKFPIIMPNMQHIRARIAKQFGLSHDIMRHTFISMFVAKFRSLGEAALQAGNSESIIRKHYLDLKSQTEATQFFGILPKRQNLAAKTMIPRSRGL